MALIDNKVLGDSIKKELGKKLLFAQLGATVDNKDLASVGAGNTIQIPWTEILADTSLQKLDRGDSIATQQLSQDSITVSIEQYAKGVEIFDRDMQYSINGGELEDEAVRQITEIYKQGLDNLTKDYIVANSARVDIQNPLTASELIAQLVEFYGEKTFDGGVAGVVLHPTKIKDLMNDPNFFRADKKDYVRTYGSTEIGKLFNQIPVLMSEKIGANAADPTKRDNLVIVKGGVITAFGKAFDVEQVRDAERKANLFFADFYFGVGAVENQNKVLVY